MPIIKKRTERLLQWGPSLYLEGCPRESSRGLRVQIDLSAGGSGRGPGAKTLGPGGAPSRTVTLARAVRGRAICQKSSNPFVNL